MLWWDDGLTTGIEVIDQQHKDIFSKVGEILSLEQSDDEKIKKNLDYLQNYVEVHFRDEEELMSKSKYIDFEIHRDLHQYLINELEEIRAIFKNGITIETLDRFKMLFVEWLVKHINEDDRSFARYLKE